MTAAGAPHLTVLTRSQIADLGVGRALVLDADDHIPPLGDRFTTHHAAALTAGMHLIIPIDDTEGSSAMPSNPDIGFMTPEDTVTLTRERQATDVALVAALDRHVARGHATTWTEADGRRVWQGTDAGAEQLAYQASPAPLLAGEGPGPAGAVEDRVGRRWGRRHRRYSPQGWGGTPFREVGKEPHGVVPRCARAMETFGSALRRRLGRDREAS
jgi:hypothetical protein